MNTRLLLLAGAVLLVSCGTADRERLGDPSNSGAILAASNDTPSQLSGSITCTPGDNWTGADGTVYTVTQELSGPVNGVQTVHVPKSAKLKIAKDGDCPKYRMEYVSSVDNNGSPIYWHDAWFANGSPKLHFEDGAAYCSPQSKVCPTADQVRKSGLSFSAPCKRFKMAIPATLALHRKENSTDDAQHRVYIFPLDPSITPGGKKSLCISMPEPAGYDHDGTAHIDP